MPAFVHLHVHTQYSLLDGAIRFPDLFAVAKSYQMPAVTITDHGNMYGAFEFYLAARKAGLKPIIGCELYLAPKSRHDRQTNAGNGNGDSDRNHHLVLLAKDRTGYQNLMKLSTLAYTEGFYYKPRIDKELLRRHHQGLIALSSCLKGEVASHLLAHREDTARKAALEYQEIFGADHFYLELQANGLEEQALVNEALIRLGRELNIPLVATNDCHYLKRSDARAHEILLCIQTGKTVLDDKRMKFHTDQLYFKSPDEMAREFAQVPDAIANTVRIAERCNLELETGHYHFPVFPLEPGETIDQRFEQKVLSGFTRRLEQIRRRRPEFGTDDEARYRERLEYELRVIREMGFPAYFLIVADFINWAKDRRIPVGPGRGSAAGSLVAYVMGITDLDPIEHGLFFERFLNVERISMPDIDVDFCIHGREEVLKYVVERYGSDRVAQITTFGTMMARAVVRDVGRALALPYNDVDRIAKLIPSTPKMTLTKAFELEPRLLEMQRDDPQIKELFEIALVLEGLARHASTHAAGVVIADKPIVEYLPLYRDQDGRVVTQYPMKYVEATGLIKFDFLGLRNLTVINDAVTLIAANRGVNLEMDYLPLDDPATYELLSRADTTGVFQLESSGMRDILVRLRPENFADIVALVALYRPGPLESGMVENYIKGKHGEIPVTYELEQLQPILEPTYGVILYQEQVMKISNVLANYSMGEADLLRRAMGKKVAEIMQSQRQRFLSGTRANGIDDAKANHIFDLMEKFAGYGFNKSHSAAYALIAYQTAYLKTHYPVEFMAALLNSFLSNTDQVVKLMNECRDQSIAVLPPDVNTSSSDFTVARDRIRFGLGAVKNVGAGAIESILHARSQSGPFQSIHEFCERVDTQKTNRRVIEQLIKCGAFDSIHANRAQALAALDQAMDRAQAVQKDRQSGQVNLFALMRANTKARAPKLPDAPPWDQRSTLQFEKESLGFYLSGHPLDNYREQMAGFCLTPTDQINTQPDGASALLCGIISIAKEITTKKGERMAFLMLEDKQGTVEVVAFPETFAKARVLLEEDEPRVIIGSIQHDEKSSKIIADQIVTIEQAQLQAVEAVHICLDADHLEADALTRLRHLLISHPGSCDALLNLTVAGCAEAVIALSEKLRVSPTQSFFEDIQQHFGPGCVKQVLKAIECKH
ncbi:MAG: DNA polymerase III subunit alpha [Syntrophobacteraceae bacterium CG2_30_61_12]|nr:MAG: DNA polymerase III subunit alpha [Syntrophobacteraceae bacterium CG2_30_61_12]